MESEQIIAALVMEALNKTDTTLAQVYQLKTNAGYLANGLKIEDILEHYRKTSGQEILEVKSKNETKEEKAGNDGEWVIPFEKEQAVAKEETETETETKEETEINTDDETDLADVILALAEATRNCDAGEEQPQQISTPAVEEIIQEPAATKKAIEEEKPAPITAENTKLIKDDTAPDEESNSEQLVEIFPAVLNMEQLLFAIVTLGISFWSTLLLLAK